MARFDLPLEVWESPAIVLVMNRHDVAGHICNRIDAMLDSLIAEYERSEPAIGYFVVDDLLPDEIVQQILREFPTEGLKLNSTLRERKMVSAQMDQHAHLVEETLFAFHDERVVARVARITGIPELLPDEHLYAGGISAMCKGHFLNPHLDNSHDKDRQMWRVLNLLYYVSPDWSEKDGGSLELWPDGVEGERITIPAKFNRLVVMATHDASWHSVDPIKSDAVRRCISNYYFSPEPLRSSDKFHVTSFRGRPEQKVVDAVLQVDAAGRSLLRKLVPGGVGPKDHRYKR